MKFQQPRLIRSVDDDDDSVGQDGVVQDLAGMPGRNPTRFVGSGTGIAGETKGWAVREVTRNPLPIPPVQRMSTGGLLALRLIGQ